MIRLKNLGEKTDAFTVTQHPISNPQKSPNPAMIVNPQNPTGAKIKNPDMYSAADVIEFGKGETIEFGENKKYNEEQGEYLYRILGTRENAGPMFPGDKNNKNYNFLLEVDEKGVEVRKNLFIKYRSTAGHTPFTERGLSTQEPAEEATA